MPVVLLIAAYLLGTFPSAILIARANGVDISQFGSGNPGASNVTRALGWRKGAWVYILDTVKAAIATGLALGFDGRPLAYWCGVAAIVGHMFPVFRRFNGGKGVAAGSGVLFVLHPLIAPFSCVIWWIVTKLTGKAAVGSLVAVGIAPAGLALLDRPAWEYLAVGGLSALILIKHWRNMVRLLRREEPSLRGNASPVDRAA